MTINGTGFVSGATLTFIPPEGGTIASSTSKFHYVSDTQVTYDFNNASDSGGWSVRVNNPDRQSSSYTSFSVSVIGACCVGGTQCILGTTRAACSGVWEASATSCTNCSPALGACCLAGSACTAGITQSACTSRAGTWKGAGSTCAACEQPNGKCCAANGGCSITTQAACTGAWTTGGVCSSGICGEFTLSNQTPICNPDTSAPAVLLNWGASSGATSYTVYRNGSSYLPVGTSRTFYNISNLTAGSTYTYFVRASNSSGTRDSNTTIVSIPGGICGTGPGAFTLSNEMPTCNTSGKDATVLLRWTSSPNAATYRVYKDGSLIARALTERSFFDSNGNVPGSTHQYLVRARNSTGTYDSSITVSIPLGVCQLPKLQPPKIDPPSGAHFIGKMFITATAVGTRVRFTTDGREPNDETSMILAGTLELDKTTMFRARAFATGYQPSEIAGAHFFQGSPATTVAHQLGVFPHTHEVRLLPRVLQSGQSSPYGEQVLVHGRKTWLVVHGGGSSPSEGNIVALGDALAAPDGQLSAVQVVYADWSELASSGNLVENTHIDLAAQAFALLLESVGIRGAKLNVAAHSWGTYVADQTKNRTASDGLPLRANKFIALDPALVGDGKEDAHFSDNTNWSWAFYGSLAGSWYTSKSAHESFVLTWSDLLPGCCQPVRHSETVYVYADLVSSGRFNGIFLPRAMPDSQESAGLRPWKANQYNWIGEATAGQFEAVIDAQSGYPGYSANRVCFFSASDERESCDPPMVAARALISGGAPVGACCAGAVCMSGFLEEDCTGTWREGRGCAPATGVPHSFCCPANFNRDAKLDVIDTFAFLTAWFAGGLTADFDESGVVTVQDVFAFLTAWFAGC